MNFKFLSSDLKNMPSPCFLTWPNYLSSESAQKITSRWRLQNSLVWPSWLYCQSPQRATCFCFHYHYSLKLSWGFCDKQTFYIAFLTSLETCLHLKGLYIWDRFEDGESRYILLRLKCQILQFSLQFKIK